MSLSAYHSKYAFLKTFSSFAASPAVLRLSFQSPLLVLNCNIYCQQTFFILLATETQQFIDLKMAVI